MSALVFGYPLATTRIIQPELTVEDTQGALENINPNKCIVPDGIHSIISKLSAITLNGSICKVFKACRS